MSKAEWNGEERAIFARLRHPGKIQDLLDSLPYLAEGGAVSPRVTLRRRAAQCFGGAVLAAAALRELGHRALLVDLRAHNDDDHVLAVFRRASLWGAVGKSNFTTLRYREPVYRSLRELVMSYFDLYFNARGEKSLRSYSTPLDLARYDRHAWQISENRLLEVEQDVDRLHHVALLSEGMESELLPASSAVLAAGLLGANPDGLFQPG